MANNKSVKHTVSPNQPVNISPGDEWYNVTTNKLYKAVAVGGTSVEFIEINPETVGDGSVDLASPPAIGSTTPAAGSFTNILLSAGTVTRAPAKLIAGTNLTTATAGAVEYDTAETIAYFTGNATNGRGLIPATQYLRLTANGANTATTISPFFGANSSIPLVANGIYEIEIECYYQKNTAGTLVWTLSNTIAVTNMTVNILTAPVGGYTAVPTASAVTVGALLTTLKDAAFTATASIGNNSNMWSRFKIILENASSTSVRLNVTNSAGSITPIRGSFWKATRIANVGTYAT